MRSVKHIWFLICSLFIGCHTLLLAQTVTKIDFFKTPFVFETPADLSLLPDTLSNAEGLRKIYDQLNTQHQQQLVQNLLAYKESENLNDWLYYQLVRRVAEVISPKHKNYKHYTLYKWYYMNKSGYDARLAVGKDQLIFYIKNEEDISDIPFFTMDGKQYTCLNYHDYGKLFSNATAYTPLPVYFDDAQQAFSYKITHMPEFKSETYMDKKIDFRYHNKVYNFTIRVNDQITNIFANYPGVDFETYFNIPLTRETYHSLIPVLKDNVKNLSTQNGVDYLMRFTRYAFLYEDDDANFGKEKRLAPEQTLMQAYSDCDDRAALFFYLVKEIYNLPMVAILFPTHITMGVALDKPIGTAITYNGRFYSICEPTPQAQNLPIGELADKYKNENYQIVYQYSP
ncbi:hypothetical protein ACL9RF_16280 [Sphingobacterium sp. Mn56C]|uniref:hypothetical protein n=1 Tax=Sphingobacterium sp. Mn56C TaxID=3395261 RepID=UPI003BE8BB7D